MRDVMVDLETTGTSPDRAAIIQIAAVKFSLQPLGIGDVFNRSLLLPPTRHWQEDTRHWWMQQKKEVLLSIYDRMENPFAVMKDFVEWCAPGPDGLVFWGKPSHFDYAFVSSYLRDFDLGNPFHYRTATDMRSFIRGLYYPDPVPELDIPFDGDVHNALFDAFHQIKELNAHVQARAN